MTPTTTRNAASEIQAASVSRPYKAKHRYADVAPRKMRPLASMIRGMNVDEAIEALKFLPNRGARLIEAVVKSAVGNAEDQGVRNIEDLVVQEVRIDGGPMFKRIRPRARGTAFGIKRRLAHIVVTLFVVDEAASEPIQSNVPKPPSDGSMRDRSPDALPSSTAGPRLPQSMGDGHMDSAPQIQQLKQQLEQIADIRVRAERLLDCAADDPSLGGKYILDQLKSPQLPDEWVCHLLLASEHAQFDGEQDRRNLAEAIVNATSRLLATQAVDGSLAEAAVGAGLRRFGLSAPLDCADKLERFINPERPGLSQRVFIATRILYSKDAPAGGESSLASRLERYLRESFASGTKRSPREIGHLSTAVVAAAAAGVAALPTLLSADLESYEANAYRRHLELLKHDWSINAKSSDSHISREGILSESLAALQAGRNVRV